MVRNDRVCVLGFSFWQPKNFSSTGRQHKDQLSGKVPLQCNLWLLTISSLSKQGKDKTKNINEIFAEEGEQNSSWAYSWSSSWPWSRYMDTVQCLFHTWCLTFSTRDADIFRRSSYEKIFPSLSLCSDWFVLNLQTSSFFGGVHQHILLKKYTWGL